MINILMGIVINAWRTILNVVDKKIIKFVLTDKKCVYCNLSIAVWRNRLSNVYACNKCVPRNCCKPEAKVKRAAFLIQNYNYRKEKDDPCGDWDKM